MLRQNPVKRRRGELNIERRILPVNFTPVIPQQEKPNDAITPQPNATIQLPDNSTAKTKNDTTVITGATAATITTPKIAPANTPNLSPQTSFSAPPLTPFSTPQDKFVNVPRPVTSSQSTPKHLSNSVKQVAGGAVKKDVVTPKVNKVVNNVTKIQPEIPCDGIATSMPDADWRISQYHLPEIFSYLAAVGAGNNADNIDNANNISAVDDIDNFGDIDAAGVTIETGETSKSDATSGTDVAGGVNFGGGIFGLLNDGLRRAREFDDKLFISIFEAAIRASCKCDSGGLAKETLLQLRQFEEFEECYRAANFINEKYLRVVDGRLFRESRIKCDVPLLLFPQAVSDVAASAMNAANAINAINGCVNVGGGGIFRRHVGGDYFVMFNGDGVVINPSRDFWEGLYYLGGVVGDVSSVVVTERGLLDFGFIEQLRFYRDRQAVAGVCLRPVRFFVPVEFVGELSGISGVLASDIESIQAGVDGVMISDGVKLSFQADQVSLSLTQGGGGVCGVHFVGRSGVVCGNLAGDIVVFRVNSEEDFLAAVGLAKISDVGLAVFDVSQGALGFVRLLGLVRSYIDAAAVVAGINLACNIAAGCFLDIVKAFDSDKEVWSLYSEIDNSDDNLYYFAKSGREKFIIDGENIIEKFITNRRRRHGLYFNP
ncbi:MAG: hypothetical protein LBP59_01220 [Planctomycetaceae bacterium]|jgi:hypothetical protein|nr:hypothetical protein [Planctomycetaceae bacterium]